jgi:hypothetical protein
MRNWGRHLFEGLVRSPHHLATLGDAAGGQALTHIGRLLAELQAARRGDRKPLDEDDRTPTETR